MAIRPQDFDSSVLPHLDELASGEGYVNENGEYVRGKNAPEQPVKEAKKDEADAENSKDLPVYLR